MNAFEYTFGIEEEYFLSSRATGNLASQVPKRVLAMARSKLGDSVTAELLQSQIEIASPILHSDDEARTTLAHLRRSLADVVEGAGLNLVAASTYPLGVWREQRVTEKPRYDQLISDFRIIGQRNLVCGMHVHVAVPPEIDRVDVMNRAMPWVPVFLALSTSSPFWGRQITGLLSYRQAVYDEWPRSGIPDFFADQQDYDAFAKLLQGAGAIKDASYFWWAMRPALKYPTLELRIADVCTRVEDAATLAGLYRCLISTLVSKPELGRARSAHTRRLIDENRWRAKRDGTAASFIDEHTGEAVPLTKVLEHLIELTAGAAAQLGYPDLRTRLVRIIEEGTSSHQQLRIYNEQRAAGDSRTAALRKVLEWLTATTRGEVILDS